MPTSPSDSDTNPYKQTLSLSLADQWTLHHILLDRIEQEGTGDTNEPPPIAIYQAFDTLDKGETQFTTTELKAIQSILADYLHSTDWWEGERSQLEHLLHCVTDALNDQYATRPR